MLTLENMAKIRFGSVDAFAAAAGRCKKSAKRILDPATNLNTDDLHLLVKTLDIPVELISPLFFGEMFASKETTIIEFLWLITHCPEEKLSEFFDWAKQFLEK